MEEKIELFKNFVSPSTYMGTVRDSSIDVVIREVERAKRRAEYAYKTEGPRGVTHHIIVS